MLCRVALVRSDVSEERIASIIMIETITELGTTLAVIASLLLQERHGVTSQKTAIFIVNAVKTSNLAIHTCFLLSKKRLKSRQWTLPHDT
jgi:hypothetical protein